MLNPKPSPVDSPGATRARVVLASAPPGRAGRRFRTLVAEGRAAGLNIIPGVRSTYMRRDRTGEADEALPFAKATGRGDPALERRLRRLHRYDVPEVFAVPVVAGLGPSPDWLTRSVAAA